MKDPVTPLAAAVILVTAASFCPTSAAAQPPPVVVELFTSQGCSSCPPADAVLDELAGRADVLALGFHVTYWDRLGWTDTFGLEAGTERQEAYARSLGLSGLYTPQMVIGGRIDVVGSSRGRVLEAVDLLREHGDAGPAITIRDGRVRIEAGAPGSATVWLVAFDDGEDIAITGGENRGRALHYQNVVREIEALGHWRGEALELPLPLTHLSDDGPDNVAVLLQRERDGAILTAARLRLTPG